MKRLSIIIIFAGTTTLVLIWIMSLLIFVPDRSPGKYIWPQDETIAYIHTIKPIRKTKIPKSEKCTKKFLSKARNKVLEMRSCKTSDDCIHVKHGYLSMLAVNKIHDPELDIVLKKVTAVCGYRKSHDGFYSDFGIKIECEEHEKKCSVKDVIYDEMLDSTLSKILNTYEPAPGK